MTEEEKKYIYTNNKGEVIFTPVYEKYNELFFEELLENTGIKIAFEAFNDTSLFERYMLNTAQFSAASSLEEARMMQAAIFRVDGSIKGFSEFSNDVQEVIDVKQEVWLRVEYEMQRRQTVAIAQFQRMKDDSDLYPYWVYRGRMDGKERPEHVAMEGKVFRIGDPAGDSCFPPIDWNCRCNGESVDGRYLDEKKVQPQTNQEAEDLLQEHVGSQFRYNPANTGPMPSTHSYFQNFPNANAGNSDLFGKKDPPDNGPKLTGLKAKGLHFIMNVVGDWRQQYHVDSRANIVFQNQRTYTNIRLSDRAVHDISRHHNGIENIPECLQNPSEIWTKWENVGKQMDTLRAYILFGRISYVVTTLNGEVLDAFPVSNRAVKKYRTGVII